MGWSGPGGRIPASDNDGYVNSAGWLRVKAASCGLSIRLQVVDSLHTHKVICVNCSLNIYCAVGAVLADLAQAKRLLRAIVVGGTAHAFGRGVHAAHLGVATVGCADDTVVAVRPPLFGALARLQAVEVSPRIYTQPRHDRHRDSELDSWDCVDELVAEEDYSQEWGEAASR